MVLTLLVEGHMLSYFIKQKVQTWTGPEIGVTAQQQLTFLVVLTLTGAFPSAL